MAVRFKLPFVQPKQAIRAEDWNALVTALNSMPEITAGAGITLHRSGGSVVVSTQPQNGEALFATITAHTGDPNGDLLENIRYSAVAFGRPDAKVMDRLPDFGRSGVGQDYRAIPARVGCPCLIYRVPDAAGVVRSFLEIKEGGELGERKVFRRCGSA